MVAVRDWRTSQRYIRIGHNKAIKNYFQTVKRGTTRESLRNSLLITSFDSADQMLIKMQYFNQYLSGVKSETVPLIPEFWNMRVGSARPQLVVAFRPKNRSNEPKNKASKWALTIPHFDATGTQTNIQKKLKLIPEYEKGNYQGTLTLKDNSKLIIYAKSIIEAERFIKKIVTSNLIDKKYLDKTNYEIKVGKIKGNYKEIRVTPTYAKYFSTGQKNLQPDWVSFIE